MAAFDKPVGEPYQPTPEVTVPWARRERYPTEAKQPGTAGARAGHNLLARYLAIEADITLKSALRVLEQLPRVVLHMIDQGNRPAIISFGEWIPQRRGERYRLLFVPNKLCRFRLNVIARSNKWTGPHGPMSHRLSQPMTTAQRVALTKARKRHGGVVPKHLLPNNKMVADEGDGGET